MKSKISFGTLLARPFSNKRFAIAFSLIVSFVLWLVIMINENPVRQQIFSDMTATISIENTVASEMGLGIVSNASSQKFTVTVSGPNYIVSTLKPEDLLLTASVTDVTSAGTYTLDVVGTRNSAKSGYTFVSVSPSTIDVTFDFIDTKQFNVTPRLVGVSPVEGLIADTPVMADAEQSTITVKGPRSVIQKIDTVATYAEVNETIGTSKTYDAGIVLYNADGNVIYRYDLDGKIYDAKDNVVENTYLTLSFTNAKVTAPIVKKATVQVEAAFTNLPEGLTAEQINYTVDHQKVTITAPPDVINANTVLTLSPIDFTTVSSASTAFEVSVTLPDGVKILDNVDTFHVTLDLTGYTEKVFTVNEIRTSGLGGSLAARTSASIRNVKVCGPKDVLAKMKAKDLYAVVDLTDKPTGAHTVDAVIKSTTQGVWQVGTYNTTVTISQK